MSTLYVVRHGQARLFTDDYDRLSELGFEQARALARHWRALGVEFDHAYSGSLRRQRETARTVAREYESRDAGFPELREDTGFDEYPAESIVRSFGRYLSDSDPNVARLAERYERATDGEERYRSHHRLLEAVIGRWFDDDLGDFDATLTGSAWRAAVGAALGRVRERAGRGTTSVVFTSGGVIATILQSVLEAPAAKAAELNWRVMNASVTQFTFSAARISLDRFNDVAHLDPAQMTYR